jgi:hypothetical protein
MCELWADYTQVILATIQFRSFFFSRLLFKRKEQNIQNYDFACSFVSV